MSGRAVGEQRGLSQLVGWVLLCWLTACLGSWFGPVARAQEAPTQAGRELTTELTTEIAPELATELTGPAIPRRVYLPADVLAGLQDKLVPLPRAEFERQWQKWQAEDRVEPGDNPWRSVHYELEFDGRRLLKGSANLKVELSEAAPEGRNWQQLFDAPKLAIERIEWRTADGSWEGAPWGTAPDSSILVRVDRTTELQWSWSIRGSVGAEGTVQFRVPVTSRLPHSITLLTPAGWRPTVRPAAIVRRAGLAARPWRTGETAYTAWQIMVASGAPVELELTPPPSATVVVPPWRQETKWQISPAGASVESRWLRRPGVQWPETLQLRLPADLHLQSVRQGDQELTWVERPGETGDRDIFISCPRRPVTPPSESEPPDETALLLTARFPWEAGRLQKLPRLQLQDQASLEFLEVQVAEPWTLFDYQIDQGTYLGSLSPQVATERSERHGFRIDQPQGFVELKADWEPVRTKLRLGSSIELSPGLLQARMVLEAQGVRGDCYTLSGYLRDDWEIDTISSLGPQAVTDWEIRTVGDEPPSDVATVPSTRQLVVRLRQPIRAQEVGRWEIIAQRRGTFGEGQRELKLLDCWPLEFSQIAPSDYLWALRARPPLRVAPSFDPGVEWLSPSQLADTQRPLVSSQAGDWLLTGAEVNHGLKFQLTPEVPAPTMDASLQVTVHPDRLVERIRLACRAEGTVPQLDVVLVPGNDTPNGEDFRWHLEGKSAEQLLDAERSRETRGDGLTVDRWRLAIPPTVTAPFTIVAERSQPRRTAQRVTLVSVVGAEQPAAQVQVTVVGEGPPEFRTQGSVQTLPADDVLTEQRPTIQRRFAYAPDRIETSLLEIRRTDPNQLLPRAWSWQADVDAYWTAAGQLQCQTNFWIENLGLDQLELRPFATGTLQQVYVDGNSVPWVDRGQYVTVALPDDRRFILLSVVHQAPAAPSPFAQRLHLRAADISLPVLQWHWDLWIPPGFQARPLGEQTAAAAPQAGEARPLLSGVRPTPAVPAVARQWLNSLGKTLREMTGKTSWQGVVARWLPSAVGNAERWPGRLWIDRRLGVASWQLPTAEQRRGDDVSLARGQLRQNGQSLLIASDDVAVVSAECVADFRADLLATDDPQVWLVESGRWDESGLAEHLIEAPQLLVEVASSVWPPSPLEGSPYSVLTAWNLVEADSSSPEFSLYLYRPMEIRLWATIAFLSVLGALYTFNVMRDVRWVVALVPPLVCCWFWVWPPYRLICQATLAALLVHWLMTLVQSLSVARPAGDSTAARGSTVQRKDGGLSNSPAGSGPHPPSGPPPSTTAARWMLWGLAVTGLATGSSGTLRADEAASALPKLPPQSVVIPWEPGQDAPAPYVYLSEELWNQLLGRNAARQVPTAVVIREALYEVYLRTGESGKLELDDCRASFEIWGTSPPRWSWPWDRSRVTSVAVDGRLVAPAQFFELAGAPPTTGSGQPDPAAKLPAAERTRQSAESAVAGWHQVHFELKLEPQRIAQRTGVRLPLPAVAKSLVVVHYPSDVVPPEMYADGELLAAESTGGVSVGQLGWSRELEVRWAAAAAESSSAVDVLTWLRVGPDQVLMQMFARATGSAPPADDLRVSFAEPLRRIDTNAADAEEDVDRTAPSWQLPWRPLAATGAYQATGEFELAVRNRRWSIPPVELSGVTLGKRWVAVTVDPQVRVFADWLLSSPRIARQELAAVWGETTPAADFVVNLPADSVELPFDIRTVPSPVPMSSLAQHELGLQTVLSRWEARVQPTGNAPPAHRCQLPDGLEVENVEILAGGRTLGADWIQSSSGGLLVTLRDRPTGEYRLLVTGRWRTPQQDIVRLLPLRWENSIVIEDRVRVRRTANALVELRNASGFEAWKESTAGATTDWASLTNLERGLTDGLLVADLMRVSTGSAAAMIPSEPIEVHVAPNELQLSHVSEWRIEPDGASWRWSLAHTVTSLSGTTHQIAYELPANWVRSVKVSDGGRAVVRPSIEPNRAQLILFLPRWNANQAAVQVSGTWDIEEGDSPQIPGLRLLTPGQSTVRVTVPARVEDRPLRWEARQMTLVGDEAAAAEAPAAAESASNESTANESASAEARAGETTSAESTLLEGLREPAKVAEDGLSSLTWESSQEDFRLTSTWGESPTTPKIQLVDLWINWPQESALTGWMSFDFPAAGLRSCHLAVPPPFELIAVLGQHSPVMAEPVREGVWRVQLAASSAPQHLRIVFRIAQPSAGLLDAELPRLQEAAGEPWPVARTLVTVAMPTESGPLMGPARWRSVSADEQTELRLASLLELVDKLSSGPGSGESSEPGGEGRIPWEQRIAAIQARLARRANAGKPLESSGVGAESGAESVAAGYPIWDMIDVSRGLALPLARRSYLVLDGAAPRFTVRQPLIRLQAAKYWGTLSMVLVALSAMLVAIWRTPPSTLLQWQQRWGAQLTVLTGICVSLLIGPAWLGWLVASAGLAWALIVPGTLARPKPQ